MKVIQKIFIGKLNEKQVIKKRKEKIFALRSIRIFKYQKLYFVGSFWKMGERYAIQYKKDQ